MKKVWENCLNVIKLHCELFCFEYIEVTENLNIHWEKIIDSLRKRTHYRGNLFKNFQNKLIINKSIDISLNFMKSFRFLKFKGFKLKFFDIQYFLL